MENKLRILPGVLSCAARSARPYPARAHLPTPGSDPKNAEDSCPRNYTDAFHKHAVLMKIGIYPGRNK